MWASIVAALKLLPGLLTLLNYIKDEYEKYKQAKIIREAEKKKRELGKITEELKNAKTDKQRADLLKRLSNINS